jgi:hypothetical protein
LVGAPVPVPSAWRNPANPNPAERKSNLLFLIPLPISIYNSYKPIVSLLDRVLGWWKKYQEDKHWREFYARLDRNKEGKFTKKEYIQNIKVMQKEDRNKNGPREGRGKK